MSSACVALGDTPSLTSNNLVSSPNGYLAFATRNRVRLHHLPTGRSFYGPSLSGGPINSVRYLNLRKSDTSGDAGTGTPHPGCVPILAITGSDGTQLYTEDGASMLHFVPCQKSSRTGVSPTDASASSGSPADAAGGGGSGNDLADRNPCHRTTCLVRVPHGANSGQSSGDEAGKAASSSSDSEPKSWVEHICIGDYAGRLYLLESHSRTAAGVRALTASGGDPTAPDTNDMGSGLTASAGGSYPAFSTQQSVLVLQQKSAADAQSGASASKKSGVIHVEAVHSPVFGVQLVAAYENGSISWWQCSPADEQLAGGASRPDPALCYTEVHTDSFDDVVAGMCPLGLQRSDGDVKAAGGKVAAMADVQNNSLISLAVAFGSGRIVLYSGTERFAEIGAHARWVTGLQSWYPFPEGSGAAGSLNTGQFFASVAEDTILQVWHIQSGEAEGGASRVDLIHSEIVDQKLLTGVTFLPDSAGSSPNSPAHEINYNPNSASGGKEPEMPTMRVAVVAYDSDQLFVHYPLGGGNEVDGAENAGYDGNPQ